MMLRVALVVVAVVAAAAAAVRAERTSDAAAPLSLLFRSEQDTSDSDQEDEGVPEALAQLGKLCEVRFDDGSLGLGALEDNDEALKQLDCLRIEQLSWAGRVEQPDSDADTLGDAPSALCPLGTNMAGIVRENELVSGEDIGGGFHIKFRRGVRHVLLRSADDVEQVIVVAKYRDRLVGVDTHRVKAGDSQDGFMLISAPVADDAQFDALFVRLLNVDPDEGACLRSIALPCAEVGGGCGAVRSADAAADAFVPLSGLAKRDVDAVAAVASGGAKRARAIAVSGGGDVPLRDFVSPCGALCATDFSTYDEGFVNAQRPARLDTDDVLKSIAWVGSVSDTQYAPLYRSAGARSPGFKAFCPLAINTGGVVKERGPDTSVHADIDANDGEFVIELHGKHRSAVVDISGFIDAVTFTVGLNGKAGASAQLTELDSESGAFHIVATDGGFFNEIAVRIDAFEAPDSESESACIAAVAVPCDRDCNRA